jgi:hypothetical protein
LDVAFPKLGEDTVGVERHGDWLIGVPSKSSNIYALKLVERKRKASGRAIERVRRPGVEFSL